MAELTEAAPTAAGPTAEKAGAEKAGAPRRRQARGERRIAELLTAAGLVFAESGYSATTTNAIAARAGVSPGTLYQYFPNKDAIADAVAVQYTEELGELITRVLKAAAPGETLAEQLDRIMGPLVEYHVEHPACIVLFVGPDTPQRLTDLHQPLQEAMLVRIAAILGAFAPDAAPEQVRRSAEVAVHMFKGLLPLVLTAAPEDRPRYIDEMKLTFLGYFSLLADRSR